MRPPYQFRLLQAQRGHDWRNLVMTARGRSADDPAVGRIWRDYQRGEFVGLCCLSGEYVRHSSHAECRARLEALVVESMVCAACELADFVAPYLRRTLTLQLARQRGAERAAS